ncbi:hypothetical protein DFH11DRAFT_652205 [Phellopilus nigrolimitatus]|nr:hypothetical protein DFH11DRAFT_652205 [Phellopilus nigrolimitatus]
MRTCAPPPSLSHPRLTVGIVSDSPFPAGTSTIGVGVSGASDTLDVVLDAHIIINTNAVDDGVSHEFMALDQNVNDDLAMGAPPGAPGAIDATPFTRTNTLPLYTRYMTREHHRHHGHAPANACRDAHRRRRRECGSGVGQGQNSEGDDDSAEGAGASIGVGIGSRSGGRMVSTVAHDKVERRLALVRERHRLAFAAAAALASTQTVARFSVARKNGTTTASEFARPRGASIFILALRVCPALTQMRSRRRIL